MSIAPGHTVILASAGTGKTYRLTSRFIELIAAGEKPERILATTFTRKAAGEILRKVVARLADAVASDEKLRELRDAVRRPELTRDDAVAHLGMLARSLDCLSIGTIDAFFARLASGAAMDMGGAAGATGGQRRLMDEDEDANLRAEAVSRVLHGADHATTMELVRHMNPGRAGCSVHAELLRVVGDAYQHFLGSSRAAWEALPIPDPLESARLAAARRALEDLPVPSTKDGLPRVHWSDAKSELIRAAGIDDWEEFIKITLVGRVADGAAKFGGVEIGDDVRGLVRPLIAHAAAVLLAPHHRRTLATWAMIAQFHAAYGELKASRGLATFDDIPRLLLEHAVTDRTESMYYRLDAQVRHVLLDEFQDTSVVQWRLLHPLVHEIVSQEKDRSFFCVGDVKQSLYSWRQAEPELLARLETQWPQVAAERLVRSRRSSPAVIDCVNLVMGSMATNPAFHGPRGTPGAVQALNRWRGMFSSHETVHRDLPGYCRLAAAPGGGEATPTESRDLAFRAIAGRIAEIHRGSPASSIGVLFRSRGHITTMKLELAALGINASEEGGNPLDDSPPVAAILSMLTLADHPGNTAALFHVAESPLGPIVGVRFPGTARTAARTAARTRRRLLSEGFSGVIESWVRKISRVCSPRDVRRLDQLVSLATRFDERTRLTPGTRPASFVEFVQRERVEDPTAAPVRLMTIHASKGLEFDVVVLPWLEEAIGARRPAVLEGRPDGDPLSPPNVVTLCPPAALLKVDPDLATLFERWREREILEELCVLYVALTRAVHALEIFVQPKDKGLEADAGKSISLAKVIRGALASGPCQAGGVLWEHGDPTWASRPDERRPRPSPATAPAPIHITLDAADANRSRHIARRSPSAGDHLASRPTTPGEGWPALGDALQDAARSRGILFHAWLEAVDWLDAGVPSDADLGVVAARLDLPAALDIDAMIREFRPLLAREPLRRLLSRASYAGADVRTHRELAFSVLEPDGGLLVGRIDRLVTVHGPDGVLERAEIIDFKTDQLSNPALIRDHAAGYRAQMSDYRLAAARLLACDPSRVRARLVFTTHDQVIDLEP